MDNLSCLFGEGCNRKSASTNLTVRAKVLVGTGIGQIRYLNRALMRFDSKVSQFPRSMVWECIKWRDAGRFSNTICPFQSIGHTRVGYTIWRLQNG